MDLYKSLLDNTSLNRFRCQNLWWDVVVEVTNPIKWYQEPLEQGSFVIFKSNLDGIHVGNFDFTTMDVVFEQ